MRVLLPWGKKQTSAATNNNNHSNSHQPQAASLDDHDDNEGADGRASVNDGTQGRGDSSPQVSLGSGRLKVAPSRSSPVSARATPRKKRRITEITKVAESTACPDESKMTAGRPLSSSKDDDDRSCDDDSHRASESLPDGFYVAERPENEPEDSYREPSRLVVLNDSQCFRSVQRKDEDPQRNSKVSGSKRNYEGRKSPEDDVYVRDDTEEQFRKDLKNRGLEIVEQEGDGNCMFRAVSLQVYGDSSSHADVRRQCMDFMSSDPEHFGNFVVGEDFADYIARKRQDGVHGNNPELQALSELFNRPVEVFTPQAGAEHPINIFHAEYKTSDPPIRLSYHDGNHYNAVLDPILPTAGLGLGLPGLQPGLADKMQVAAAVTENDQIADLQSMERAVKESQDDELRRVIKESEQDALNRVLKESAFSSTRVSCRSLSRDCYTMNVLTLPYFSQRNENKVMELSDLDATNLELEQAILAQSMETYRAEELGQKQRASESSNQRPPQLKSDKTAPASVPSTMSQAASMPTAASVSVPPVASAASANQDDSLVASSNPPSADEYPPTVQELVMNGFELAKVIHAYELIGDNFDDLLSFLIMNASSA